MSNYIDNIVKNAVTYDLVSKPLANDMANEFSIQSTYAVGDYVMHDYKLYKCISAVNTAENWNSAKWQECKIGDEINGGVKFTAQTLTSEQKAQARNNIGAVSQEEATPDAIRYSVQSLTDAQKNQARVNVGTVASTSIAEEFSTSNAYAVGDMVMYNSKLYKFKTAHSAGAWNNAQVDAVSLESELSGIKNDLNVLEPSATSSDVGKTLMVKTVSDGKVTEYEFGESSVSGAVRYDIAQGLTDAQKEQSRTNIGAVETPYQNISIYDNAASVGTTLITSSEVEEGVRVSYDILMPSIVETSGNAGYLELKDSQDNRLGVYGRLTSNDPTTVFSGDFVVPNWFSYAVWNGNKNAISVKLIKQISAKTEHVYVRYDEPQSLTNNQKLQARENIGISGDVSSELFNGSASVGTELFDSDDVWSKNIVSYSIVMSSDSSGKAGYIELLDYNDARLAVYGRLSGSDSTVSFNGVIIISDGFSRAVWSGAGNANAVIINKENNIATQMFDGSATDGTILFKSNDIVGSKKIAYSFDVAHTAVYYPAGYMELMDNNDARIAYYGRGNTSPSGQVHYEGIIDVPSNFAYARWKCVSGGDGTIQYVSRLDSTNAILSGSLRFDASQYLSDEEKAQARKNIGIESETEVLLYKGSAVNEQVLFNATDVVGMNRILYSFDVNYASGNYVAGHLDLYNSNDERIAFYGRAATVNGHTLITYTGIIDIPSDFSYAKWRDVTYLGVEGSGNIHYIKANYYEYDIITNPYERYALHKYGTFYNGYPHAAFPGMCVFDNKIIILYRNGKKHGGDDGGVIELETIGLDGVHRHVKTIRPTDFEGVTEPDARDMYCTSSLDGNYLIIIGGFAKAGQSYWNIVLMCLDKNFDILNYTVTQMTDYPYGNIMFTPQGKMIFSTFSNTLVEGSIYHSNEVFAGDVRDLTFEKTVVFTPEITGLSSFSECCFGYFNDSLVFAVRSDVYQSGYDYTPIRITNNLEGTDGWGNTIKIQGCMSHSPKFLPYYRGKYLPFVCSKSIITENYYREPLFAYIDLENHSFVCSKNIDETLLHSANGYPAFVRLFDETYAIAYYQEALVNSSVATSDESLGAVYFKWINARVFFPQLGYYNWKAEIPSGN